MLLWTGWSGEASLTRCLVSRHLHEVRDGNVTIWGNNISDMKSSLCKGSKAGTYLADGRTSKEEVWLEQMG